MAIITNTISAHPTSHDTTNISYYSVNSSHKISAGYTNSNSTTYAQVHLTRGSQAESYVFYKFDFGDIPSNATNISVTAKAKGYVNNTSASRVSVRQMQLCTGFSSNITFKGSALTMSNSATEQTFSTVGSWTVAELKDSGIRFYCKRGTSSTNTNYYMRIYGATVTVTYEYDDGGGGPTLYVKESGAWNTYNHVYKKVNGTWVEQDASTWSTLFDTSTNYVKG